ncbi:Uncharacterised protein [Legionella wadsworthii]|uniref:L,D-transpeptidase catalytic domain n=1 Tax=Legionella wadsworthii TaxID=28088 RepID=A0A378LSK5_9GAMM|nr:murein L,D-transpeptidase catalytic domain family protein [Legionella wadsworthii]STY28838.1 Uncharacterised protein [Legionella wadsworthii]
MIDLIAFLFAQLITFHYPTPNFVQTQLNISMEQDVLQKLSISAPNLNIEVIKLALRAYNKAFMQGRVKNPTLTIIDFSLPSNEYRMWIFDMENDNLILKSYVAHGKNSGTGNEAYKFSNDIWSKESSLGTFITEGTYMGHNGYSLNLEGLEKEFNSNAYKRRVVVHGAPYVEPSYIKLKGKAGASWGCPAVPSTLAKSIINTIKNGSVLFAYYPDNYFLNHSQYTLF